MNTMTGDKQACQVSIRCPPRHWVIVGSGALLAPDPGGQSTRSINGLSRHDSGQRGSVIKNSDTSNSLGF